MPTCVDGSHAKFPRNWLRWQTGTFCGLPRKPCGSVTVRSLLRPIGLPSGSVLNLVTVVRSGCPPACALDVVVVNVSMPNGSAWAAAGRDAANATTAPRSPSVDRRMRMVAISFKLVVVATPRALEHGSRGLFACLLGSRWRRSAARDDRCAAAGPARPSTASASGASHRRRRTCGRRSRRAGCCAKAETRTVPEAVTCTNTTSRPVRAVRRAAAALVMPSHAERRLRLERLGRDVAPCGRRRRGIGRNGAADAAAAGVALTGRIGGADGKPPFTRAS